MKHQLRSAVCTEGRRMAGARALWVAAGMKPEQFGKAMLFPAMVETYAILALLVSILAINAL